MSCKANIKSKDIRANLIKLSEMIFESLPNSKEDALNSSELEAILGIPDKEIRAIIPNLQRNGVKSADNKLICALPCGYWKSSDKEELKECYAYTIRKIKNLNIKASYYKDGIEEDNTKQIILSECDSEKG